jgi:hypothetical protein
LDANPENTGETGTKNDEELSKEATNNTEDAVKETSNRNTNKAKEIMYVNRDTNAKADTNSSEDGNNEAAQKITEFTDVEDDFTVEQDLVDLVFAEDPNFSGSLIDLGAEADDNRLDDLNSAGLLSDGGKLVDIDFDIDLQVSNDGGQRGDAGLSASARSTISYVNVVIVDMGNVAVRAGGCR